MGSIVKIGKLRSRKIIFGGGGGGAHSALRHRRYKLKLEEIIFTPHGRGLLLHISGIFVNFARQNCLFASSARVGESLPLLRASTLSSLWMRLCEKNDNYEFYPTTRVVFHRFGLA